MTHMRLEYRFPQMEFVGIFFLFYNVIRSTNIIKVEEGSDQEITHTERNNNSKNRGEGENTKLALRYLY